MHVHYMRHYCPEPRSNPGINMHPFSQKPLKLSLCGTLDHGTFHRERGDSMFHVELARSRASLLPRLKHGHSVRLRYLESGTLLLS